MGKTWANVEQIFQNREIDYELKDWLILCYLEGRQFYYSPQTGKWRIKGKRAWPDCLTEVLETQPERHG